MTTVAKCALDATSFGARYVDQPCVVDGNLVTARTNLKHILAAATKLLRNLRCTKGMSYQREILRLLLIPCNVQLRVIRHSRLEYANGMQNDDQKPAFLAREVPLNS